MSAELPINYKDSSQDSINHYINLSLTLYNESKHSASREAAQNVLQFSPNNIIAFNNICSSYNAEQNWVKGIEYCEKALYVNPNYQLAKNNLQWAKNNLSQ